MTIALGILADDGVVVAADTEEGTGYAGGLKTPSSKINLVQHGIAANEHQRAIAITGAGRAGYLDALAGKIGPAVAATDSIAGAQAQLESELLEFYAAHIHPFSYLPEHDRPDVAMLVALQGGFNKNLWTTDKTTVRACGLYGAVGVGAAYANHLLARFVTVYKIPQAGIVAAYVVYKVKELIEGCGKNTHVVFLKNGIAEYLFYPHETERLEDLFRQWEGIETGTLYHALGLQSLPSDYGSRIFQWLEALRKDFEPFAVYNPTEQVGPGVPKRDPSFPRPSSGSPKESNEP